MCWVTMGQYLVPVLILRKYFYDTTWKQIIEIGSYYTDFSNIAISPLPRLGVTEIRVSQIPIQYWQLEIKYVKMVQVYAAQTWKDDFTIFARVF